VNTVPETVTVPTDALIDAAATFYAYADVVLVAQARVGTTASELPWRPAGDLLVASGLWAANVEQRGPIDEQEREVLRRVRARGQQIASELLRDLAAMLSETAQEWAAIKVTA